ncbi:MAG: LysM peptidoglycan-binding domain-containing protein [Firmicutes bacterium]|mgnify:CR=1 FL=1|nr:LysM peptidoglycan-binding domain-containing protein [Bacillota bacterium]
MKKTVLAIMIVLTLSLAAGAASPEYHTIVTGDTLIGLAQHYETTVEAFIDFNPGISPLNLKVGQELVIPVKPLWSYHVVQLGDNARSLAMQYKVPEEMLRAANGLSDNKLTVGETIRIPIHFYLGEEVSQTKHTVEIGDTLYKIAKQYKVTLSQLVEWNQLQDIDNLIAGQILIVG